MQARAPLIDGFPFAEAGGALQGLWPVEGFTRLRDLLNSTAGELQYELRGARDDLGRLGLRVRLAGMLQLTCQRCLGALPYPLEINSLLILVHSEAEIETQSVDPDSPDRVLGAKEMDVGALLEDEILLAVPFAPRHQECAGAADRRGAAQASPFADLRGLLDRGGRARN